MGERSNLLSTNVSLLRARASRHAYYGLFIALAAVLVATAVTALLESGQVSLAALLDAQKNNASLWIIDCMPFAFAIWGQYVGVLMAHEAGAMVMDQTEDLRARAAAMEVHATRQTTYDELTGLPNRTLFLDRLEQAIENAHGNDFRVGAMVIDLDGFKEINEALGQHNGDRVLKSVARRLSNAIPEPATVARLSGDTFAILQPRIKDPDELVLMARRVGKGLEPPCALENLTINLHASTGGALYPDDSVDADTLLNHADSAMHEAKRTGAHFMQFKQARHDIDPKALSMTAELRTAIEQDQLELYLQPIVECGGDALHSAEALVRWHHPKRGMMPPGEFIPRAERSGLIVDLSKWVLQKALEFVQDWQARGIDLRISINLSARSLLDPDFPDLIAGLLASADVAGNALVLEITEDTLMADQRRARDILGRVSAMGVEFSIDDFGTGYSQLAYLKQLPVNEVKIDRSFIKDMHDSAADASIVEATINLAHALDLRVVGEGIEESGQQVKLQELGCDLIQGFYIGRPMPASELPEWLAEWRDGWHTEVDPALTIRPAD